MRVPAGLCGLDLTRPWKFRMDQDGEKQQGKKVNAGGRCETMGTPQFGTVFSSKNLVIRHLKNKLQGWHLVFFSNRIPDTEFCHLFALLEEQFDSVCAAVAAC